MINKTAVTRFMLVAKNCLRTALPLIIDPEKAIALADSFYTVGYWLAVADDFEAR
jgi:hypothetical protein